MGIIALLKDILNGNLSERAPQLLLAKRLVALLKPEDKYRPIAVGELFYRLAGVIAVRNVTQTLLSYVLHISWGSVWPMVQSRSFTH
jgi:hypothetical protein